MTKKIDYNQVFEFMQKFNADFINRFEEMIIDRKNNIWIPLKECNNLEDIETWAIMVLCRPIGKALEDKDAKRLLKRVNDYFQSNLSTRDMRIIYGELCYREKIGDMKEFIKRGFPMEELQ
jgi:hypothetical protein